MARAALTTLAALVAAAVPAASAPAAAKLDILAAASLTQAFPSFDGAQTYSFAGSDTLASQIRLGAPADVFAAASPVGPQALYAAGLVEKPVTFATNRLVLAVPRDNPAGITSVFDLTKPGVKLVVGTPTVPIGTYTRQVLGQLGLSSSVLPHVVDQEKDVSGVVAKLALGVADAGFVYATDARAASGQIRGIPLPRWAQPPVRYQVAVVKRSAHRGAARAFVQRLLGKTGRTTLQRYGFGVPMLPPKKARR